MSQPQLAADHRPLRGRLVLGIVAAATLVACAQPPRPADASPDHWSGRLAVQVEDDAGQSFSAGFELKGHPSAGELTLINRWATSSRVWNGLRIAPCWSRGRNAGRLPRCRPWYLT